MGDDRDWRVGGVGTDSAAAQPTRRPKVDKASAYYHYTLAHMYAELASAYGNRGDYLDKAIENYKAGHQGRSRLRPC